MMRKTIEVRRRQALAALLGGLLVGIVGCGDNDEPPPMLAPEDEKQAKERQDEIHRREFGPRAGR